MPKDTQIAFALGGLGGMNAHGAGFLAAAQDVARSMGEPLLPGLEFISCSSGMIHWTAEYLRGADLRRKLEDGIEAVQRATGLPGTGFFRPWQSPLVATFAGLPGVFDPANWSYARHFLNRAVSAMAPLDGWFRSLPINWDELWDLLLPARLFIPTRDDAFYEEIAHLFNEGCDNLGIAFNSYNLSRGIEYLHLNEAALARINKARDEPIEFEDMYDDGLGQYKPIDGEYVKAALWLFEYGFDQTFHGENLLDGAYRRQIILDEATFADRIYVPRPLNQRWIGRLPRNLFEREDLKIEMWFNASYHRQKRIIDRVNKWTSDEGHKGLQLRAMDGGEQKRYHRVDVIEIPIKTQRGFFDYFIEHLDVFDQAYDDSLAELRKHEMARA